MNSRLQKAGNSYSNQQKRAGSSYGKAHRRAGDPYGNAHSHAGDPYGKAQKHIGKPYVKTDYSVYRMSFGEILKYAAIGVLAGGLVCYLCYNSLYSLPLAGAIAFFFLRSKGRKLREERQKKLLYHFGGFIASLHNAMRSGYALENAISVSANELASQYGEGDDCVRELRFMENRLRFNVPVEELFADLGKRSCISDIELFSELISVAKRTGGNMGKLMDDTWHTVCGKIDTGQEIDKQLSSVKFEQKIMSIMPAVIILYMKFSFGGFMDGLYGNLTGVIIMTVCLLLYAGAFLLGKKLVKIEV